MPDAFSGSAARERSKIALQVAQPDLAVDEARAQISLRPIPAESLTILALAALQAGDGETGRLALEAASRRGWREPISQLASGQGAFEQGEYEIASQRVVALLSTGNLTDPALGLLAGIVVVPEGREAMATRLASAGRWQTNTLGLAAGVAEPGDWAATIALGLEKGAELPCSALERLAMRYERDGHPEAASTLAASDCLSD